MVPAAEAEVIAHADVVVCGAGSAGLGAALAAARAGAEVVLLERWPFFGGNATASSLGSICGLYAGEGDDIRFLVGGVAREWAEALTARGAALGPIPYRRTAVLAYSPWAYKRLADELVRAEPNITPLLHALISGVVSSGDAVEAVVLASKRGPLAVRGRVFVDATGDADVVFHSGCRWEMGEPGRLQYPSMQFAVQDVDWPQAMEAGLDTLNVKMRAGAEQGRLPRSGGAVIPTLRPGEGTAAMTRVAMPDGRPPDGTDPRDLTWAEMSGRDVAEASMEFLRSEMPGFEQAWLSDTATTVGIRETRHLLGRHVLSFEEAAACTKHPDGVAASAWPFEFHTEGTGTRWEDVEPGDWFEIPYRSLVPVEVSNMLVAGRCISADHEALASSRVTGVCMAVGEAAGRAAARCAQTDTAPADLDGEKLRAELIEAGVIPEGGSA